MTGIRQSAAALLTGLALCAGPRLEAQEPAIVPRPASVEESDGAFPLDASTTIRTDPSRDRALASVATLLQARIRQSTGLEIGRASGRPSSGEIRLRIDPTSDPNPEAYSLVVADSAVLVTASSAAGVFYGTQSLLQLLPVPRPGPSIEIPGVVVRDRPRFPYRGMHLDVGRHMFPVAFIERYIDLMSRYKMNTFHWHLTEDQGWRIQIDRYPRLTEVGAYRRETILEKNFDPYVGDGIPYGGFYTKDEVREVVAYAAERFITVIPEIEMPGHSLAALAAYPGLACTDGPFEVGTRWGVYEDIYCPRESTFGFLQDVLDEVIELFPGTYIHIGGDEAPKTRSRQSLFAQAVIEREGLSDEDELQSWFIRRIERFLASRGRRLMGWDEILEGGLPPDATVMSWRGMEGGIEAARQGHDVVMTPGSHAYFDHYQGDPEFEPLAIGDFLPLETVYSFEPVPDLLTSAEASHILGVQANLWTEYIATPGYAEYMAYPRALAMAEVGWTESDRRDWGSFEERLGPRLAELDALGVEYRIPGVAGLEEDRLVLDSTATIRLTNPTGRGEIRYTLDGSRPTPVSTRYEGALRLPVGDERTVVTAAVFLPSGRRSPPSRASVRHVELRAPDRADADGLSGGLRYEYFEGRFRTTDDLDGIAPLRSGVAPRPGLGLDERPESYGFRFSGYLSVERPGVYRFRLTSDDGSRLWIGDELVVDHDGLHGATSLAGAIALAQGLHEIRVEFFQAGGGQALSLEVAGDDAAFEPIPTGAFSHDR